MKEKTKMSATDYLRKRSIVPKDKTDLIIGFDDGSQVSVVELMEEYASLNRSEWISVEDDKLHELVFKLANELSIRGYGNQAVSMHRISNSLIPTTK